MVAYKVAISSSVGGGIGFFSVDLVGLRLTEAGDSSSWRLAEGLVKFISLTFEGVH